MANSDSKYSDLKRLGSLLRFYRGGLSQSQALDKVAEKEPKYLNRNHSQLSRWEKGKGNKPPPQDFLWAFADAFGLLSPEMEALMALAGYDQSAVESAETLSRVRSIDAKTDAIGDMADAIGRDVQFLVGAASKPPPVDAAARNAVNDINSKADAIGARAENIERGVQTLMDAASEARSLDAAARSAVNDINSKADAIGARSENIERGVQTLMDAASEARSLDAAARSAVNDINSKADAIGEKNDDIKRGVQILVDAASEPPPMDAAARTKDALRRVATSGTYAAGWVSSALGQNRVWVLGVYAAIAFTVVLNASMLLFSTAQMGRFGFFTLIPSDGSHFRLTTQVVSLLVALAASALFESLRLKMYGREGPDSFASDLFTVLPPYMFMFFNMPVSVNAGMWVIFPFALGVGGGLLAIVSAFQDSAVTLSERAARMAQVTAIAVIILMYVVGVVGTQVAYTGPSPLVIPDHNLMIMGLAIIAYLATALGRFPLAAIRSLADRYRGASGEARG